jgi:hypothetical protein
MSSKPSVSPPPSFLRENENKMSDKSLAPSVSPSPSKISPQPRKPPAPYPTQYHRTRVPQTRKVTTLPTVSFEPTVVNYEVIMTAIPRHTRPPTIAKEASATILPSNSMISFEDAYPFSICLNSTVQESNSTILFKQLTDFYNTYIHYYMPDESGFRYISLMIEVREESTPLMSIDIKPKVYYTSSAAYPPSKQVINSLIRNSTLDASDSGLLAYLKAHTNGLDSVDMTRCLPSTSTTIANDAMAGPSRNITSFVTILWVSILIVAFGAFSCLVLYTRRKKKPQAVSDQESSGSKSVILETTVLQRKESELNKSKKDSLSCDSMCMEVESAELPPEELKPAIEHAILKPNDPAETVCLDEAFTVEAERKKVVRFDDLILFHTISQCLYSPRVSDVFSDESSLPDFLLHAAKDDDCCLQTLDYICCEGHQDDYHVFSKNEPHIFGLDEL